jgi:hypothetical protein
MPSAEFEPAIPAIKRLQTCALDRTATTIVTTKQWRTKNTAYKESFVEISDSQFYSIPQ